MQRWVVLVPLGVFFALPLVAMLEFTTRKPGGGRTMAVWAGLVDTTRLRTDYAELLDGVRSSLQLAVLTVVLMLVLLVPSMVWVRLRLPRVARTIEFLCLLPLTIPAIVLVVGLAPVYAWVTYFFGSSSNTLVFAYTVLVLPYAYRAIDAGLSGLDVKTLAEAARSLGASWFVVLWRVVVPNLRAALLSAAFISVALVLGEFTIASLLNRQNLQVAINFLAKRDAAAAIAVSFAALVLAFLLLLVLSLIGRGKNRRST
jgi:putative spermidine/putrescine transport system permease protein